MDYDQRDSTLRVDAEERNPDVLRAEMSLLTTQSSVQYSADAYAAIQNVQAQCAADIKSICSSEQIAQQNRLIDDSLMTRRLTSEEGSGLQFIKAIQSLYRHNSDNVINPSVVPRLLKEKKSKVTLSTVKDASADSGAAPGALTFPNAGAPRSGMKALNLSPGPIIKKFNSVDTDADASAVPQRSGPIGGGRGGGVAGGPGGRGGGGFAGRGAGRFGGRGGFAGRGSEAAAESVGLAAQENTDAAVAAESTGGAAGGATGGAVGGRGGRGAGGGAMNGRGMGRMGGRGQPPQQQQQMQQQQQQLAPQQANFPPQLAGFGTGNKAGPSAAAPGPAGSLPRGPQPLQQQTNGAGGVVGAIKSIFTPGNAGRPLPPAAAAAPAAPVGAAAGTTPNARPAPPARIRPVAPVADGSTAAAAPAADMVAVGPVHHHHDAGSAPIPVAPAAPPAAAAGPTVTAPSGGRGSTFGARTTPTTSTATAVTPAVTAATPADPAVAAAPAAVPPPPHAHHEVSAVKPVAPVAPVAAPAVPAKTVPAPVTAAAGKTAAAPVAAASAKGAAAPVVAASAKGAAAPVAAVAPAPVANGDTDANVAVRPATEQGGPRLRGGHKRPNGGGATVAAPALARRRATAKRHGDWHHHDSDSDSEGSDSDGEGDRHSHRDGGSRPAAGCGRPRHLAGARANGGMLGMHPHDHHHEGGGWDQPPPGEGQEDPCEEQEEEGWWGRHSPPPPLEQEEEEDLPLGYGPSTDLCMYQHYEQLSEPCSEAIDNLYQVRQQFWQSAMAPPPPPPHRHALLLLLGVVVVACGVRRWMNRGRFQKMRAFMTAIRSNEALKATIEKETGLAVPEPPCRPTPGKKSWRCRVVCALLVLVSFLFAVEITGHIVHHMDERAAEEDRPPACPGKAVGILLGVLTVELLSLLALVKVGKWAKNRFFGSSVGVTVEPSAPIYTGDGYAPLPQGDENDHMSAGTEMTTLRSIGTTKMVLANGSVVLVPVSAAPVSSVRMV